MFSTSLYFNFGISRFAPLAMLLLNTQADDKQPIVRAVCAKRRFPRENGVPEAGVETSQGLCQVFIFFA